MGKGRHLSFRSMVCHNVSKLWDHRSPRCNRANSYAVDLILLLCCEVLAKKKFCIWQLCQNERNEYVIQVWAVVGYISSWSSLFIMASGPTQFRRRCFPSQQLAHVSNQENSSRLLDRRQHSDVLLEDSTLGACHSPNPQMIKRQTRKICKHVRKQFRNIWKQLQKHTSIPAAQGMLLIHFPATKCAE